MTRLFCLVGPTAAGKSDVAVAVLKPVRGTIISADARQVYRFLDVGTNKPGPELLARVPVLLLNLVTPEQPYSAADFSRAARRAIADLRANGTPFMLVGGSGLYLKALFRPLFELETDCAQARQTLDALRTEDLYQTLIEIDPESSRRLHPNDRQRILRALEVYEATGKTLTRHLAEQNQVPDLIPRYVGLELPRSILRERIAQRFSHMLDMGLVNEVQHLLRMGYDISTPALDAIGYREIIEHLAGRFTLSEAISRAEKRTRDYAKRQMTWFRRQPGIQWVNAEEPVLATAQVRALYDRFLAETG